MSMIDLDTQHALRSVLNVLNKALKLDERAVHKLCETRVPVDEGFADSDLPFVVFQAEDKTLSLGFIGALSGCLMAALALPDKVRLCALYEADDTISRFYFIECLEKGYEEIEL